MTINPFAVMQEEFDNTGIVFTPDNNRIMTLNKTGVVLWHAFAEGLTTLQAAERLAEKFEVSSEDALRDTEKFAQILCEKGLLSME